MWHASTDIYGHLVTFYMHLASFFSVIDFVHVKVYKFIYLRLCMTLFQIVQPKS